MADYNSSYTGVQIDANLALAATAVQDADLATVATTGAYTDLTGKPTLGTAAATASTDYATAAQGALADTATQPGDDAADLGSGAATDGYVLTADGAGGAAWEAASGGGGTPGGSDTQVQFNDGGAFGGDSGFTFDKTNNTLGLGGGTITASDPIIDMAQTWNNGAVAFTAIKSNVTNTASAAATVYNKTGSALFELQTNGDTKFWVGRDGGLWLKTSEGGGAGRSIAGIGSTGAEAWNVKGDGIAQFASVGVNDFLAATRLLLSNDAILVRDAANTLAQRNGVNAQAFNLYNTYTDASNYERGVMSWASNVLTIGAQSAGTGTVRNVKIYQNFDRQVIISAGGWDFWHGNGSSAGFGLYPYEARHGNTTIGFSAGNSSTASDAGLKRSAATVIAVTNGSTGGGSLELQEMTAPAAPGANNVRIYAEDDGAGKTRLMARFATGAAVQIAIEP